MTFENEVLNLAEIMIPPMQSSVMSGKKINVDNNS
jgi:hypothetical protein